MGWNPVHKVTRGAAILLLSLLISPLALEAQSPEERIEAARSRATQAGIPVVLLDDRVAEGRAKGISLATIASVVSFGNHPERLQIPCTGSGEQVRQAVQRDPALGQILRYFDAATAAARVRIPVMVCAAREDPAVPPVGQFSVFHALVGQKSLLLQAASHQEYPGQGRDDAVRHAAFSAWLR